MAGYYDKNKDYSKELQRTDLSASERDRLTKERQNKINDKYGGREPNMIGSDKTYSQTYDKGGSRRDDSSSGSSGTPYVKGPGYGTGGYTNPGIYGAANLQPTDQANYWKKMTGGADMSRRPDLAGGYSISNGYTVFYDENGYAKKAVKGVADYTPHQDINAGNGSYGKSGAWTDNEMMSALDRSKIQDIRNRLQRGEITGDQANQAANAIRAGYGYTIDKNGYVTDSGALSSVNDLRRRLGLDVSPESAELAYYRYLMGTDTSPIAQASGKGQSFGDYLAENGGVQAGTTGYGTPAYSQQRVTDINAGGTPASNFTAQTGTSFDIGDGSDYLKELYAKKVAAELAALKSAYEQNTATLDANRAQIAPVYDIARNSAANQNALSRGAFQEMAVANGLNTGTTGQAALAQDVVLQQNLSQIDREQAEKTAAIDLQRSQLDTEYRNAIAKAEATGDAELANALYEEYVRQQNLYAKYGGQTGGSGSGSSGGSTVVKPTLTASQVQSALKNGIVTDDVISAFDYYYGQGAYDSLYGTGKLTSGGSSGGGSTGKKKGSYSNGSLTNQQVKQLQKYYGVSQDGKWGANSKKAAGGLTADQAWAKYQGGGSGSSYYGNIRRTITGYMSQGNYAKAQSYLKSNWNSLTEAQQKELSAMFG
ncbi:hypothetical protein [Dysosmobacter sp.]|uniref:hypothetical protein n=1 Tax=Dysosmobacter sp. TaxID=2591382 RepID=UPI002F935EF8